MDSLAVRLKYVREKVLKNIPQDALAARLKAEGGLRSMTGVSVMRYERGERMPGADYVRAIAAISGADVRWLLTGEESEVDRDDRAGGSAAGGAGDAPTYNEEREESELARIGALPDSLLRAMERESIAAVIRAQGMRDACRAARIEAEKAPDRSAAAAQYRTTPMQGFPDQSAGETERAAS